jgi:hypothetical protein
MSKQVTKRTPSGHLIVTEYSSRAEGSVPRVMIKNSEWRSIYGYSLKKGETVKEAEEKFQNGTYRYHEKK